MRNQKLRSDGKPRASAAQITAARQKAAKARWQGRPLTAWRTIRVHEDTYDALDALRARKGLSWDGLLARFAAWRR